jgi:hypothetical protein
VISGPGILQIKKFSRLTRVALSLHYIQARTTRTVNGILKPIEKFKQV